MRRFYVREPSFIDGALIKGGIITVTDDFIPSEHMLLVPDDVKAPTEEQLAAMAKKHDEDMAAQHAEIAKKGADEHAARQKALKAVPPTPAPTGPIPMVPPVTGVVHQPASPMTTGAAASAPTGPGRTNARQPGESVEQWRERVRKNNPILPRETNAQWETRLEHNFVAFAPNADELSQQEASAQSHTFAEPPLTRPVPAKPVDPHAA